MNFHSPLRLVCPVFGGCEGVCKECKDTCEMSIFVKERKETAEKILNEIANLKIVDDKVCAYDLVNKLNELATYLGVKIKE